MTPEIWTTIIIFVVGIVFAIIGFLVRQAISDMRTQLNKIEDLMKDHITESVVVRDRLTAVETTVHSCPECTRRNE